MKLSYSSSNLTFSKLFSSILVKDGRAKTIDFFKNYTGKDYVLLTSSCRSALYLTYCSLRKKGKVITSPLTCAAAIEPIIGAGNQPVFADIDPWRLIMDPSCVAGLVDQETIAIQAIHLGGVVCDMTVLQQIAREKKICLVEDCAQGFAADNHQMVGRYSDVACFSLAKNLYGIGGGILATNDAGIYEEALKIQSSFPQQRKIVILSRILRGLTENYQGSWISALFQKLLFGLRNVIRKNSSNDMNGLEEEAAFKKELVQPSAMIFNIAAVQQKDLVRLHEKRKNVGNSMDARVKSLGTSVSHQQRGPSNSYVKYYCETPVHCRELITLLNQSGIEAKHLEAKHKKMYQARFDNTPRYNRSQSIINCPVYLKKHDHILSLPCREDFSEHKLETLFTAFQQSLMLLSNEKTDSF